ncbi:META domain-containing protein [Erwinia pyri]|uniref:META domain-containing protein n=1 Tax=Erwinia pyri TaxID=3062598 RepID=A0AA50HNV7_9GAMM|nr:META domain-containing protein [Erwinia sp. DE2]WLS80571.1 META domain-containing protein [Erwinia sp. DE2]
MKNRTLILMGAMLLAGCATSQPNEKELARSFQLSSVDGQAITAPQGMKPGINFSKEMHVTGVMCNRFFGQGTLEKGVLSVPQMASTRMMCSDQKLNQWEMTLSQMLNAGAKLKLEQNTLTLQGAGHTLVYVAE